MVLDESDADALNFVGIVYQYQDKYNDAINYFKKAIKMSSKKDEYYYNCASTYFKINDIVLAKKYYNLAISLNPDNPNYHLALANLYYFEKNYKRALKELEYDFYEANLLKGIILFDMENFVLAKKEFDKLYLQNQEDDLLNEYRGKIDNKLHIN